MKTTSYTDKKLYSFHNAVKCGAKTKHNHGNPCRNPAVRGKSKCRLHGGANGSGAGLNNKNALKHGLFTKEVKIFKQNIKEIYKIVELNHNNSTEGAIS